jgi:hypothetical protein
LAKARALATAGNVELSLTMVGFQAAFPDARVQKAHTSSANRTYNVTLMSTRLMEATCSCPDYARNGPLCKHGGAALLTLLSGRVKEHLEHWGLAVARAPASSSHSSDPRQLLHSISAAESVAPLLECGVSSDPAVCFSVWPTPDGWNDHYPIEHRRETPAAKSAACRALATLAAPVVRYAPPATRSAAEAAEVHAKYGNLGDLMRALREATEEVDTLRTEVAMLREQATERHESGGPPRLLDAAHGHESRVAAIRGAQRHVLLVCFTFDLDDVTAALISAKSRHSRLDERVMIDQSQALNGNTRNLRPKVMQLVSNGVPVRLYSKWRLHAKVLLTDAGQFVGSLNWTTASLANVERVARFHLRGAAEKAERDWFDALWADAKDFDGKTELPVTPQKPRCRAASAHDPRTVHFPE